MTNYVTKCSWRNVSFLAKVITKLYSILLAYLVQKMTKIIYNIILGDFSNQGKHIHDINRTGLASPTTRQDRTRPFSHCLEQQRRSCALTSLTKQYPHHRKQSLLNQNNSCSVKTIGIRQDLMHIHHS